MAEPLRELVAVELAKPVDPRAAAMAAAIAALYPGAARAVLFYGSCLREKNLDGLMLDFYLIVSDYREAYGRGWLGFANRVLPPNVFPFAHDGLTAKYAVLSEVDFARMVASERIGVYVARIPYANPTTPENLRGMQPALAAGAALILPDEPLDAICYSCTSASVVIGDAEVEAAIASAKPGVPVVTPPMAAVRGLRALGAERISVLTPYTVETSRPMADYFAGHGFDIASFTCLGFDDDREMARIAP